MDQKRKKLLLILCLVFCCLSMVFSQDRKRKRINRNRISTFEAGVVFGRSFSQLDGDYFTGFDKGGWYGGLRGVANLSHQFGVHIEMLYSQKGSRIPHGTVISVRSVNDLLVSMDFAEVPILLRYRLSDADNSGFLEFGGYFGRLIRTSIDERTIPGTRGGTQYEDISPQFKSTELGLVSSLGIEIHKSLEVAFRTSFALTKIYENEDFILPPAGSLFRKEVEFLRNYHMTIMIAYKFL